MKSMSKLRIASTCLLLASCLSLHAQQYIINPSTDGGFEGSHGWTMLNTSNVNAWIVGSATTSAGSKAAYISNDNTANAVTNPQTSNSKIYLYKDFVVPLNANSISISFKYKNAGTSNPPPRCMFALASSFPALPTDGRSQLVGAEFLTNLNNQAGWTTYTNSDPLSSDRPLTYQSQPLIPGATYRIVFEWSAADQTNKTQQPPICQLPTAASIGGNFAITPNTTQTFTANTTGGSNFTYTWTVTGGAVISSGQGTANVNIFFPSGYTSGLIKLTLSCPAPVYVSNGTTSGPLAIDEVALSYRGIPQITGFSPLTASVGSNVTITGQNFGATASNNIVYFGGIRCTIVSASSTSITVEVPKHVSMGSFTVINTTTNLNSTYSYPLLVTNTDLNGMKYYRRASSVSSSFDNAVTYTMTSIPSGTFPKFVLADIDGDGKLDINTYTAAGLPQVYRNTATSGVINAGSLTLTSVTGVAPTSPTQTVANLFAFDVNNDGKIDLGASNNTTNHGGFVSINTSTSGTPSFANFSSIMSSTNQYKVNAGFFPIDINVDGKTDVFGVNGTNARVYYSRNTTAGNTFSVNTGNTTNTESFNQLLSLSAAYAGAAYGDLNNDGKMDVVLGGSTGRINVLQNDTRQGNPMVLGFRFKEAQVLTAGSAIVGGLRIADFDGDGKMDIVAGNTTTNANIYLFRNISTNGDNISFAPAQTVATGFVSFALAVGDMNGDGKTDIIVSNNSSGIGYYENNSTSGTISFEPFEQIYETGTFAHLEIADIDGDNKPDIIASGSSNTLTILRNKQGEGGKVTGDQTVCTGTVPSAFSSVSSPTLPSGTPQYLWQSSTNLSGTWSSAGGTAADFTPTAAVTATTYYRRRTNSSDATTTYYYSNIIKVTVSPAPATPTGATGATGYGASVLTLSATPPEGSTLQWFTASTGGTAIATGNSYTTSSISTTTSYHAGSLSSSGCPSTSRLSVTATIINTAPSLPSVTSATRCDAGAVTLTASSTNSQEIRWYDASTGGTLVYTGASFTTPSLSATTTYYAEGWNANGSSARTACSATINVTPSIVSTTGGAACPGSSVILSATNSGTGTYQWYADDGTTTITGGTTQTLSVTPATVDITRYVSSINAGCESPRVKVMATILTRPTKLLNSSVTLCGNKAATITLSPPANHSITWYSALTGGTQLGSGSSYTTPALTATTKYYALLTDGNGCTASARSEHTVTYEGPTVDFVGEVRANASSSNNTFTASGLSRQTSFIWQRSTDGLNFTDITANLDPGTTYSGFSGTTGTSSSLVISTTQANMSGYKYRLKLVKSAGCERLSNEANYIVADAFGSCPPTSAPLVPTGYTASPSVQTTWTRKDYDVNWNVVDLTAYDNSLASLQNGLENDGVLVATGSSSLSIRLDLGSTKVINAVELNGMQSLQADPNDAFGGLIYRTDFNFDNGKVEVSTDNNTWTTVVSNIQSTGNWFNSTFMPVSARYVRVWRASSYGAAGLSEFKVYEASLDGAPYIRSLPATPIAVATGGILRLPIEVNSSSGGSVTYAWSRSADNTTYTTLTDGATISGSATNTINVTSFASGNAGYYKLVAQSDGCEVSTTVQVSLVAPFYSSNAGSAALQTLSSWNTGTTGTGGSAPLDFGDGKIFILANSSSSTYAFTANWTVNGRLQLNNKKLTLGNFNATINSVTEGSSNAFVQFSGTGSLISSLPNNTAKVFPVGTTTYSPLTITNKTGTADNFSVRLTTGVLQNGTSGSAMNNVVNRTWSITKVNTASASANYGVDLKFEWNTTDITGNVGDPAVYAFVSGTGWVLQTGSSVSRTTTSVTLTGYKGNLSSTLFMVGNMTPEIFSISPTIAGTGSTVTITGQYFKDASAVQFGGTNATSYTSNSGALHFDGSNDYVTIADNAALDVTTNYTFECWVRFSSFTSGASILSKRYSSGANGYYLGLTTNSPFTGINFDGQSTANGLLEANRWYHIAAVKSGSTRTLYINGIQVSISGTAIGANNASSNTTELTLGYSPVLSSYLNGTLDEIRIWNTARTSDNILADMQGEIATNSSGLVAYYRFNSLSSTSLSDGVAPAKNGTLTNFALTGSTSNWVEGVYSPTQINAIVGAGATGNVTVTAPGGTATYNSFTYNNVPVIQYFTPTKTNRGTTVGIYGQYFTGAMTVSFGGTNAVSFTVVSDTEIQAIVGTGATGNVIVTTPGGTTSLGGFIHGVPYSSISVLAAWNKRNTSTSSFSVSADVTDANYVSSAQHSFSGLTAANHADNAWSSSNTSTTLDASTAPYLSYTIQTILPVKFDRVVIPGLKLTSGKLQLRWSVDNYASSLGEFTGGVSPTARLTSVNLAALSTQAAGTITFRVYFYNASETSYLSGGTGNTTLDGTVPATYDAAYSLAVYGSFKPEPTIASLTDIYKNLGEAPFLLGTPQTNSNGSTSFSIANSAVASISGSRVTPVGNGSTAYTFTQLESNDYASALVSATIYVNSSPELMLVNMHKRVGDAAFTIPTSSLSSGAITYSSATTATATVSGSSATPLAAGSSVITAIQLADGSYNAASTTGSLTVGASNLANPTMVWVPYITKQIGSTPFSIIATPNTHTSNSSGAATYISGNTSAATLSTATATLVSTGTSLLTITRAATGSYNAASVSSALIVTSASLTDPTLSTFPNITKTMGDASFSITAPTSISTGAFTYLSTNPAVAVVNGTTVTITGEGRCHIVALQAAAGSYNPGAIAAVMDVLPSFSYASPVTLVRSTAAIAFGPVRNGGSQASFTITPALPTGLSLNATTGYISGTPTVASAARTYTVTASINGGANTSAASFVLTVANVAPSALSYSAPPTYTVGTTIANLVPTVTGDVSSYTIRPDLPNGLVIDSQTGIISGTPSGALAATTFTVTAANESGGSTTRTLIITVNDLPISSLTYTTPSVLAKGVAIEPLEPSILGGAATGYSVNPSLPAGLSIHATTGVISGTPTTPITSLTSYTVTATNSNNSREAVVELLVNDAAPVNLSYPTPNVFFINQAITNLTPTYEGGNPTSYSIDPALPAGLSFNTTSGVISGTPTALSSARDYSIVAENFLGFSEKIFSIAVNPPQPSITVSGSMTSFSSCLGTSSTAQGFTVSGTNLIANLVVTAPAGFEVSRTQYGTYASSISLTPTSGSVSSTTVYIRVSASAVEGSVSGFVVCSSTGGSSQSLSLSGSVGTNPNAPSIPTITSIVSGNISATVYFNAPSSNGGAAITGYEHSINDGVGWSTSGTSSSPITITGLTNGTQYPVRIRALNTNGSSCASNPVNVTPLGLITWTGDQSDAWDLPSNWSPAMLPSATERVTIPSNRPNNPIVSSSPQVFSLTVASGAGLTVTANKSLSILSDLTNQGTISGDGRLSMAGTDAQMISGTGIISNLEINNAAGVTITSGIGNMQIITAKLTPTSGILTTNGNLTLRSDIDGTARVGRGSDLGGYINGNVITQRYLSKLTGTGRNGRAWRLVTIPVTGTGTLRDVFMAGHSGVDLTVLANRSAQPNDLGTVVIGHNQPDAPTATRSGYDWIGVSNQVSSLRFYQQNTGGGSFASSQVPDLNTTYTDARQGYMLFARGDRRQQYNGTGNSSPTVLQATGALKQGTINVSIPALASAGFVLVGNPYMSLLDLEKVILDNASVIGNTVYVWDANIDGNAFKQGGYRAVTRTGTGSWTASGAGSNPQYIESGTAFFVIPSAGGGTLSIKESHKVDGTPGIAPHGSETEGPSRLFINLEVTDTTNRRLVDGAVVFFDTTYKDGPGDPVDIAPMTNLTAGSVSLRQSGRRWSMEGRPWPADSTLRTIPVDMRNLGDDAYVLRILPTNMKREGLTVWLKDRHLNKETSLNFEGETLYPFRRTGDLGIDSSRFEVVYRLSKPANIGTLRPDDAAEQPSVKLYPNPSKSAEVKLSLRAMAPGDYSVHVLDITGRLLVTSSLKHLTVNGEYRILEGKRLSPGTYIIRFFNQNKQLKETLRLVVE